MVKATEAVGSPAQLQERWVTSVQGSGPPMHPAAVPCCHPLLSQPPPWPAPPTPRFPATCAGLCVTRALRAPWSGHPSHPAVLPLAQAQRPPSPSPLPCAPGPQSLGQGLPAPAHRHDCSGKHPETRRAGADLGWERPGRLRPARGCMPPLPRKCRGGLWAGLESRGTEGGGSAVVLEMTFIGFRLSQGAPAPRRSPQ